MNLMTSCMYHRICFWPLLTCVMWSFRFTRPMNFPYSDATFGLWSWICQWSVQPSYCVLFWITSTVSVAGWTKDRKLTAFVSCQTVATNSWNCLPNCYLAEVLWLQLQAHRGSQLGWGLRFPQDTGHWFSRREINRVKNESCLNTKWMNEWTWFKCRSISLI